MRWSGRVRAGARCARRGAGECGRKFMRLLTPSPPGAAAAQPISARAASRPHLKGPNAFIQNPVRHGSHATRSNRPLQESAACLHVEAFDLATDDAARAAVEKHRATPPSPRPSPKSRSTFLSALGSPRSGLGSPIPTRKKRNHSADWDSSAPQTPRTPEQPSAVRTPASSAASSRSASSCSAQSVESIPEAEELPEVAESES